MLGEPAAGPGPEDLEDGELGWPTRGGVRAVGGDPQRHLVTGGEHVFHDGVEIWEDPKNTGQQVPQAPRTRRGLAAGDVVNAVGGDELVGDSEVALVEDFLDQAARTTFKIIWRHRA